MASILDLSGEELRRSWKESGLEMRQFAKQHGVSFSAVRSKIYREGLRRKRLGLDVVQEEQVHTLKRNVQGDTIEIYEDGANELVVHSNGQSIRTLDQLIESAEVDLDIWEPLSPDYNAWESFAKVRRGGGEELIKVTLFQVKCRFIRKKPIKVLPTIQPVHLEIQQRLSGAQIQKREDSLALFLPDPQFGFKRDLRTNKLDPFHDRRALSVALQIATHLQPDAVIWGGDILDLAEFSDHFTRSPEFLFCTQPALAEAAYWIKSFVDAVPSADHYAQGGNHEKRLDNSIVNHLMAAYDLRSADNLDASPVLGIDNLLGLSRMGVIYIGNYPNSDLWLNDDLRFTHGDIARNGPGATAKAFLDRADESTMFAHIHRIEMLSRTIHKNGRRRTINVVCPGCLCRTDGIVPAASARVSWQQGIGYAYYNDTHCKQMGAISIEDGSSYFDGNHFVGQSHESEISDVLSAVFA
jgi:hypothetical protein